MDVAKEFAAAQKRLDRLLQKNVMIAMAHIEGITPLEYAERLDAEKAAALAKLPGPFEALGAAYRELHDGIVKMMSDFSRGWEAAGRK